MASHIHRSCSHVCSIIPPYILKHMAATTEVSHEVRSQAQHTLNHLRSVQAPRLAPSQLATAHHGPPRQGIVPDHILSAMASSPDVDDETRSSAQRTLEHSQGVRSDRQELLHSTGKPTGHKFHLQREVHTAANSQDDSLLPGKLILSEGQPATTSSDPAVNQCYENLGNTFTFYEKVFARNSIDNKGLTLIGSVHFGQNYGNAYWNSKQMVFGDGNKFIYNFTKALDVIGHELTHGVTENTAQLEYHNQSGALNESVSDVFGIQVKQYKLNQTADQADWLIGEDCLLPDVKGVALRSMKAPGTAFDDPRFGKDPQPATMSAYVQSSDDEDGDFGGVHTNSGIPNRAFYLVATGLGGYSWEKAGKIWYETLLSKDITPSIEFKGFADITVKKAQSLFGDDVAGVVTQAWTTVGVYGDAPDAGS